MNTPEHMEKMRAARKAKREARQAAGITETPKPQPSKIKPPCEQCGNPIPRRSKKRGQLCVTCYRNATKVRTQRDKETIADDQAAFQAWLDRDSQRNKEQEAALKLPLVKCPEQKCRRFFRGAVQPHEHYEGVQHATDATDQN